MSPTTPRTPDRSADLPVRRIDRILAFMSLGLLLLSVLCFVAIMIGSASGMKHDDFAAGSGRRSGPPSTSPRSWRSCCS